MKKRNKRKLIPVLILLIFCGVILLVSYINWNTKITSIKSSYTICSGEITGGSYIGRPAAYALKYSYTVENVYFRDINSQIRIHRDYFNYFAGKEFPVIYSNKHPKRSMLLIFPEDFQFWDLPFPDSLQWVNQYHSVY